MVHGIRSLSTDDATKSPLLVQTSTTGRCLCMPTMTAGVKVLNLSGLELCEYTCHASYDLSYDLGIKRLQCIQLNTLSHHSR